MLIDVDDVQSCLDDVSRLRRNGWRPAPASTTTSRAQPASARSPRTAATSKSPLSTRSNDARRQKLAQAMAAARAQKQQENGASDVIIYQ